MPTHDREADNRLDRRSMLRTAAVLGGVGLAGCGDIASQTFRASGVEGTRALTDELGFEQTSTETFSETRSQSVGPLEGSVTAESTLTVFSDGKSEPAPSEEARWAESDAPMATWASNSPVRGVGGGDAIAGSDITPTDDAAPFESVPTAELSLLYPAEAVSDGTIGSTDILAVATGDAIRWGDRESDGRVTLNEPTQVFAEGTFVPENAVFSFQS
ncbi:hypothetical protein SAMN06264867_105255 [Halorubrum cibi]|uniref:Uncharacterized protein n=2 Tax=Halorubrum cibi TaxID=413815 RepID=A0A521D0B6_9EURY|nr:hypothetical protein SAMN06264867_105255 [Halorubrum cibi]